MRPIPRVALILLIAATGAAPCMTAAQVPAATLEERMSQNEFHANGLDKLSPDELQRLNAWLAAHGGGSGGQVTNANGTPVFYADSSARDTIEAHVDGLFTGWRGKTVFKLDNGQEWEQAESGAFDGGKRDSPLVRIKPMLLGSWLMYVDGCGCSVRVKRIR